MERLAQNELTIVIPGTNRRDEMGGMAQAVLVFKDNALAVQRLRMEQEQEHQRAETDKRAVLIAMAETIETETGASLEHMRSVYDGDDGHGRGDERLCATHRRRGRDRRRRGRASHGDAQSVAGAAEQLTASIREIGGQMGQSAAVVSRAVTAGAEARATIEALNQEVERIGAVAGMIGEIAAKTNLLALNATIEAARAGDAGKGFAVVASEVKALATQTARSTQKIAQHINKVRAATGASVEAVARIEQTITEVNSIASSIAAAVEQQGVATAGIARNVTETATAANEMTTRITEVSAEAGETGHQAVEVRENATGLSDAMDELATRWSAWCAPRKLRSIGVPLGAVLVWSKPRSAMKDNPQSERSTTFPSVAATLSANWLPGWVPGQRRAPGLGKRLQCTVREQADDGLHLAFSGEGLTAGEADRISLETTADLVKLAKSDHVAFVGRVADAVATGGNLPPAKLGDTSSLSIWTMARSYRRPGHPCAAIVQGHG